MLGISALQPYGPFSVESVSRAKKSLALKVTSRTAFPSGAKFLTFLLGS